MTRARTALRLALGALLPPCALIHSASGEQVVITPFMDNTIFSEGPLSSGEGNSLFAGMTSRGDIRRALIAFPVQGLVPAGSTIESATMSITLTRSVFGGQATLHRLFANWGEGTSNGGGSGGGAFATDDDATWDYRFYHFFNPLSWTTAGGDFDANPSSSQFFAPTDQVVTYDFPNTPVMAADVQHWLDFGGNFGWIIIGDENRPSGLRFDSREGFFLDTLPLLTITYAPPARPEWNVDAGGSWGDPANWSASVPDSSSAVANFLGKITQPRTITLDGNRTVAELHFDNSHSYTIAPGTGGSLTITSASNDGAISVNAATHQISAGVRIAGNTTATVAAGGRLLLTGGLQVDDSIIFTFSGGGDVEVGGPQTHQPNSWLNISEAHLTLHSNVGAPATADNAAVTNLSISITSGVLTLDSSQDLNLLDFEPFVNATHQLDLRSTPTEFHALRVYGGQMDASRSFCTAAINHPLGPDPGVYIYDSGLHPNSAIGVAELVDAHGDPYLLIRATRIGDLNLDGSVTIADFIQLAAHFNQSGLWQEGDINRDSMVTIADFIALASNFNQSYAGGATPISESDQQMLASFAAANGASAVPEPGAMALILAGGSLLARRRRER